VIVCQDDGAATSFQCGSKNDACILNGSGHSSGRNFVKAQNVVCTVQKQDDKFFSELEGIGPDFTKDLDSWRFSGIAKVALLFVSISKINLESKSQPSTNNPCKFSCCSSLNQRYILISK
jgi:hypothetical protein